MRRPLFVAALAAVVTAALLLLRGRSDDLVPRGPLDDEPTTERDEMTPPAVALPPVDDRVAHNGLFAALGRATYRWRRWLPILGIAIVIGLNAWSAVGGELQGDWRNPTGQEQIGRAHV